MTEKPDTHMPASEIRCVNCGSPLGYSWTWCVPCQHELSKRLEGYRATIAAKDEQIKRCHAIMQGLIAGAEDLDDVSYLDAQKELDGEFCPGACTTACDAETTALTAERDGLRHERNVLQKILAERSEEIESKLAEIADLKRRLEVAEGMVEKYEGMLLEVARTDGNETMTPDEVQEYWSARNAVTEEAARLAARKEGKE